MDTVAFLGLSATHNPHRWYLPVTPGISTGYPFLFGGCALGAAIEAMERTTGRPLVWATGQYLSYARPPEIMDIDVTIATGGHHITQARAVGHVGDREIVTVNAALGRRSSDEVGVWPTMPEVPRPEDCPTREQRFTDDTTLFSRIDFRVASARDWDALDGTPNADGRSALWARIPDLSEMPAGALAILGDHVPYGISQALGMLGGGNSLDNTLRIIRRAPTDWVLLDVRIDAVADGFGTGTVFLWAEDGSLLATASQSTIVRHWTPPDEKPSDEKPAEATGEVEGDATPATNEK